MINAENGFNFTKRKVMLHNLKFICPIIVTCIINCYATASRLFIIGGGDILPSVWTTQGDAAAMGAFALEILPLIRFLLEFINLNKMNTKKVDLATDFSVADSFNSIKYY